MSQLIIEQGEEIGREVVVPLAGMKFGRSPANDLVLDDASVMLFHGRFFFKSDGTLWVTDFGAGEKTTVGGEPVDEHQLSVGDLVEVGATAFRVINVSAEAAAPVEPAPTTGEDSIDLGFKASKKVIQQASGVKEEVANKPKSTLSHRLTQVGVAALVLVVLVIVGPELMKIASSEDVTVTKRVETLALSYERVKADTANIFRYQVTLEENGDFSILINDLKNKRHTKQEARVSEPLMMQLASAIDESGFFEVDSDYAGVVPGRYDLYDLTIQRNRLYHHIKVLNREPPRQIKRAVQAIEDFALSEIGISPTFFLPKEELEVLADQSFEIARSKYAERDVRYGNLAKAIGHFKETMLYLETFEPKPSVYEEAKAGLEKARDEQTRRYKEYMFETDKAIRLGQWTEAERFLRVLTELVPDRSDPRYDKISAKLLNVEHYLR